MQRLAQVLSPDEAAQLYVVIRDESQRLEAEWREEFLGHFPQADGRLPASQDPAVNPEDLFEVIDRCSESDSPENWFDTFEEMLEQALAAGVDVTSLRRDGVSLREHAQRSVHTEFVEILDELEA